MTGSGRTPKGIVGTSPQRKEISFKKDSSHNPELVDTPIDPNKEGVLTMTEYEQRLREIRGRARRCEYLRHCCIAMLDCGNTEQAEAYSVRLNLHKQKLLSDLDSLPYLAGK
jgi:hypothetical protein